MEKFNGSIIQKKIIHHGRFQFQLISEYWPPARRAYGSERVLECWSNGIRIDCFLINTPILHHSRAETFKNFDNLKITFFIGQSSEI